MPAHQQASSMERQLQEIAMKGDVSTFLALTQQHPDIVDQPVPVGSTSTVLHLVARLGHVEFARELVKLRPEMASAVNEKLETPFHEACREGSGEMVRVLVEAEPGVVFGVNRDGETGLFVAGQRGHVDVVEYLLGFPRLLMLEVDSLTSSLHAAAFGGHAEIVKRILKARPDFGWKKDRNGCTPLHISCTRGHLDTTRELLSLDDDLSSLQDNSGRTPLHWAAAKGRVNIIDEILSVGRDAAEVVTDDGETVLHLGVRNNQFGAVKYLAETLDITKLVNKQDNDGNTVLHLATAGKLSSMVTYLLKLGVDVNAINRSGQTALDVVEMSNSGSLLILPALLDAGSKRAEQLPPGNYSGDIPQLVIVDKETTTRVTLGTSLSPNKMPDSPADRHRHRKNRRRRREKQLENQAEGIRNARNTITIGAVLIATVTFAAGINPPGGFNQANGESLLGRHTAFKVFLVFNILALFTSLGIVIFLVSIVPFRRKSMMKLLAVTHRVTWLSMSFMAAGYLAAMWSIIPRGRDTRRMSVAIVGIGGGCTLAISVGLGFMLANHWVRKWKWRRIKDKRKNESPNSSISRVEEMMRRGFQGDSSTNSDVDSSDKGGYHLY